MKPLVVCKPSQKYLYTNPIKDLSSESLFPGLAWCSYGVNTVQFYNFKHKKLSLPMKGALLGNEIGNEGYFIVIKYLFMFRSDFISSQPSEFNAANLLVVKCLQKNQFRSSGPQ